MLCRIYLNYNEHAREIDMEDGIIGTSSIQLEETSVMLKEHKVDSGMPSRWTAEFEYHNTFYYYVFLEIEQEEVEKIVKNLNFYE